MVDPDTEECVDHVMEEFWRAFTHPLVLVFFVPLGISLVFWMVSLLGFVDLETDLDLDLDADASDGAAGGFLESIGVAGLPPMFVVTAVSLIGWFVSIVGVMLVLDPLDGAALVLATIALAVASLVAGLVLGVRICRPLAAVMTTARAPKAAELVGREAVVRSGRVDGGFGYADATWPDGSVSRIDVRTLDDTDLGVGPGDAVRLVDWDASAGTYAVARDRELFGDDA